MSHRPRPAHVGLAALAGAACTMLALPATALADVDPHAGMLRRPDISKDHIVFVYANDLWLVDRDGGTARPLASPPGRESNPKFSPDGDHVAFEGNYEGGRDLYVMAIDGALPERLTHHPAGESLTEWTPDGEGLVFFSNGVSGLGRVPKLHVQPVAGGMPGTMPVPYGSQGAISEDGTWLAYTPYSRDTRTWKRYRGGMASDIWLFNLETMESKRMTEWEGTDTLPMWHDDVVYYLSDRGDEHRLNIWSYDTGNGRHRQVTDFDEYDVKWPSIGPGKDGRGEIVFQHGAALKVLDLRTKRVREVKVTIPGDRPELRAQRTDVRQYIQSWDISATGKRAVAEARGDIWTAPAENGSPRNLTRTSGVAERLPSWSPDGRWIAYFSDESGEYELYVTQSDGKGETRQLTEDSETYWMASWWSPDSSHILLGDKATRLVLVNVETGEAKEIDRDPYGTMPNPSWSHDSSWIAYARTHDDKPMRSIVLYDVESGEHHQVTHGMFDDGDPVFDRKGDWLYFATTRRFSPTYSDIDTTFIYDDGMVLAAVPLRDDVASPWLLESDEESWKEDEDEDEADDADDAADDADDADDEGDADAASDDEADDDAADAGHPLAGRWEGTFSGLSAIGLPPEMDSISFSMTFAVNEDGAISGSSEAMGETDDFDSVEFDASSGSFTARGSDDGIDSIMRGTLEDGTLSGEWELVQLGASGPWEARRVSDDEEEETADEADEDETDGADERVTIDLEGFEARAMTIPVAPGGFRNLAVNHRNQLLYVRTSGPGGTGIKLFDLSDDSRNEKSVQAGAFGFAISGDGKKLLYPQGRGGSIRSAAPGGSGKPVVTAGMVADIDPREEWKQLVVDAWRIQRDWFYVENMHGVDWDAVLEQYLAMLPDAVTREDVSYIIREMISELNVGHAYYWGGDEEGQPRENVGMLGVDWGMKNGAYHIERIVHGGPWDMDAKGPLSQPGLGIEEGHFVHAVNGVPMDPSKDPWAAFIGTAGREIVLTVGASAEMNDTVKEVVIRPIGSEGSLRYRAWIEHNRAMVDEASDGRVGYIYVPNTGVDGQNDLFRQFYGQMDKDALIIDERWNGGGQIPTRFIELLNRPVTNYWARRDAKDWTWPPDAHQGPKCMLINGLAGSGGDMFPWLFREVGLGKLIGTRTWGGLVGISGNPTLIDGGYTAVPTFGFYEKDGTWGIEGHGVDPDIEVIDDPAKMWDGGDPQLEAAIAHMLEEIERNPYEKPERPDAPDRSGMGIAEDDK